MIGKRSLYALLVIALWMDIVVLALFTYIAAVTSFARADCTISTSYQDITIVGGQECTSLDNLSNIAHHHSSYLQSVHVIVLRLVGTLSLLVLKPSLTAMMWSVMQKLSGKSHAPVLRLDAFEAGVGLSASPALIPAAMYIKSSHTLPLRVAFVLLISTLSLFSPLAISPIYRPHNGLFTVDATLNVGGGVGLSAPPTYDQTAFIPDGISIGRAMISAGYLTGIPTSPNMFNTSVAPFLSMHAIGSIWYAEVKIVIARSALDCGASAPARLGVDTVVTLDMARFFHPEHKLVDTVPLFLGQNLGSITNDPQVTTVYLNSSYTVEPGSVTAETSVVFLAANGTLEGAQQTITSPHTTARISSVDVLVCTSRTTLETSNCIINQGNVTSCTASVPANAPTSSDGGIDAYIRNPRDTATYLAASPVTAYFTSGLHLPRYRVNNTFVDQQILPISDLTSGTHGPTYHLPLSYITDVLFAKTAQALVQGLPPFWPKYSTQPISLTATFATSQPVLLYMVFGVGTVCALIATIAGAVSFRNNYAPLDVTRLLAISRNHQLDDTFARYADLSVPVDEEVMERRIGYAWVDELDSRALVMESQELGSPFKSEYKM
ncbi:hypothetical protein FIBSPDRAFT_1027021 [Athelia psychrophila]|uniref:Uncharacterized protein n=1 Tax=Athelia psychrophila TaxID=1759441 RepID=A0A166HH36_9AGAM|nr:hypothetical protein FIBSPDRAFT_1027021 [Fibularhizoctonia sp. CBS 109695]